MGIMTIMSLTLQEVTDTHFAWLLEEANSPDNAPAIAEGGIAPPAVLALLREVARKAKGAGGHPVCWFAVTNGEACAMLSYKAAVSAEGEVEIGYGVAQSREGQGITTRAVAALIQIAPSHGVKTFTAETGVDNIGSQRVLERNNFVRVGERLDPEDGALILWRRSLG